MMRDSAVRENTTSFSAMCETVGCPASVATARSIMRRSYDARPAITASIAVKISGRVISVRNPSEPKFTPRIGTSCPLSAIALAIAEQRAVAAEHHDEIGLLGNLRPVRDGSRARGEEFRGLG